MPIVSHWNAVAWSRPCRWWFAAAAGAVAWLCGWQDGAATPPDFQREIQPVLAATCFGCHGPSLKMVGLCLESRRAAVTGDPP